VPARQQTLRSTLAWSYDLLDLQEQQLFRRLSIFVGGCTLEAAEVVCAVPGNGDGHGAAAVFDGVSSLIDKSLLQQTEQDGEEPRFGMLETTREYGLETLAISGEMEAAQQAHAEYYLALAEKSALAWEGPQQAVWLERLERDHDNLRAAMQWALERGEERPRMEVAFRLGGALRSFWQVRGYFSEGRAFLERVLAHSEGSWPSLRAKALNDAVLLAVSQGDHDWGEALCQENLARYRELGDGGAIARTLYLLGWISLSKGDLPTAHSRLSESLALFREVGDKAGTLISLFWMGVVVIKQGEYARARVLFEQVLAMQRELGNQRGIAWALFHLAWGHFLSQSDPTMVRSSLAEAEALFRGIGDKWGIAECSLLSGALALEHGDALTARTLLEQSLALFKELGNRREIAQSISLLGTVAAVQHDWAAARVLSEESLTLAMEVGDKTVVASCLEGLASVVAVGRASIANALWAAQLWGAAEALRDTSGAPIHPVERATYERSVAGAWSSVGKKRFSAYWAQGCTMTPEQALAAQGKAAIADQLSPEPASTPPKKISTNPAGLTAREVEVLRWVACGLTDAQVAEKLIISPRTVTSHLTSIYNKLGVTSRSAATRFAVDHQLT
jgi:DNA-binding CsgD family transcriptional regulator/tetratricopeptide (TPR) repeat protein